jgi:iron complex transport system substrate-binding protein
VWNSNLKANAAGFSEYAETGAMRPDLVLADMIRILHPELGVPGEFHYFKKLD